MGANDIAAASVNELRKQNQFLEFWRRLRRSKLAMLGLAIIIVVVLSAVFADVLTPYSFEDQDLTNRFVMPCAEHLCGTDQYGRDIFTRILRGGRTSLLVSLMGTVISLMLTVIIGSVSGFFGGRVDTIIMRACDIIQAIPSTLLMVCISTVLGSGVWQTGMAIAVGGLAPGTRLIRATVLTLKGNEYIEAARASGANSLRTILTHVIPNSLAPVIVDTTMRLGGNILMISSLSFIGLGVQPPIPEWGAILNSGRQYIRTFWPLITFPGIAIWLTMFGFNVFGDGLRDALDPRLKR